ncbi:MAG: TIGR01777 family oxidoreductase [Bacteroidetes bacterium]|nr:TIGR01777 family oxidoreductase [Bacteroidota bacterium]
MERILLAGVTGFIGRPLVRALAASDRRLLVLTRRPEAAPPEWADLAGLELVSWDGRSLGPWVQAVSGCRAVINLSGASIASGRWTRARKAELWESRVRSTEALVRAICDSPEPPALLLNASATGYYGSRPEPVTEASGPGEGFLAELAQAWEAAAEPVRSRGVRLVLARIGVVFGAGGGMLARLLPLYRLGLGGRLGSGRQPIAWIHREDAVRALLFALERPDLEGPYNVVAPQTLTQAELSRLLARLLGRPDLWRVPTWLLELALGRERAQELLLGGAPVLPQRLAELGFRWRYPDPETALMAILEQAGLHASAAA